MHVILDDEPLILFKACLYRGATIMDAGLFYAPYRPGMSADELREVQEAQAAYRGPTELQKQIMDVVKTLPHK